MLRIAMLPAPLVCEGPLSKMFPRHSLTRQSENWTQPRWVAYPPPWKIDPRVSLVLLVAIDPRSHWEPLDGREATMKPEGQDPLYRTLTKPSHPSGQLLEEKVRQVDHNWVVFLPPCEYRPVQSRV